MKTKQQDKELFEMIRKELYVAAVTDVMDAIGLTHQFLPPEIRPLHESMVLVGRARTVQEADCCGDQLCAKQENNLLE